MEYIKVPHITQKENKTYTKNKYIILTIYNSKIEIWYLTLCYCNWLILLLLFEYNIQYNAVPIQHIIIPAANAIKI